jgi:ribosomal protein L7/L12
VLLTDLTKDEAAALGLVMAGMEQRGATVELTVEDVSELPKIDWPKRPLVFKRDIGEYASEYAGVSLSLPGASKAYTLQELLLARLDPQTRPGGHARSSTEFKGSQLPEITPFSNAVLPSTSAPAPVGVMTPPRPSPAAADNDPVSRLNELFPDEDAGFIPNNDDITSILDRLLPDEEQGSAQPGSGAVGQGSSSGRMAAVAPAGFSVFLAKIADEARRAKAATLLAELTGLPAAEADALSKKVIIPVLKGVTKEEAEAAKQRFAKIGILARVKGPGA